MPLPRGREAHREVALGCGDPEVVAHDIDGRAGGGSMSGGREGVGRRANGEKEGEHGPRRPVTLWGGEVDGT